MKPSTSPVRFWRRVFLAVVFVQSVVIASVQHNELAQFPPAMFYVFCGLSIILSPFMMVWVIGIQIFNPMSDVRWDLPSPDGNPLRLGNPLNFGHFAAQLAVVSGVGYLVASIWCGFNVFLLAITCILAGFGWFLGLGWCIRLAAKKLEPASSRPTI
jgi:hypothetical protein